MPEIQEPKVYANIPGLKEAADKFKAAAPIEQQVAPVSVEPTVVSNTGTEEVKQPAVVTDPPKEQPKAEPTQTTEVEVETPWDATDSIEPVTPITQTFDFSKLGSALKLEGIKSESDIVSKFNELQTKLQEVESKKEATFEGIPDDLKEVIDLVKNKNGVDWKSYAGISTVDWSKINPADLFENEFSKLPQFRNPDGSVNEQLLNDELDRIPEGQKAYEGSRIIQERVLEQQQAKQRLEAQARFRKEQSDKALTEATRNLSEILPESQYGIKFEAKHSDHIFKGISSGELLQKHLLDPQGNYDMKKVAKTFALAEYGEKMIKYHADKAKVAAKKEILTSTQNVQLDTPGTSVSPEGVDSKSLSPQEKMVKFLNQQKGGVRTL